MKAATPQMCGVSLEWLQCQLDMHAVTTQMDAATPQMKAVSSRMEAVSLRMEAVAERRARNGCMHPTVRHPVVADSPCRQAVI